MHVSRKRDRELLKSPDVVGRVPRQGPLFSSPENLPVPNVRVLPRNQEVKKDAVLR